MRCHATTPARTVQRNAASSHDDTGASSRPIEQKIQSLCQYMTRAISGTITPSARKADAVQMHGVEQENKHEFSQDAPSYRQGGHHQHHRSALPASFKRAHRNSRISPGVATAAREPGRRCPHLLCGCEFESLAIQSVFLALSALLVPGCRRKRAILISTGIKPIMTTVSGLLDTSANISFTLPKSASVNEAVQEFDASLPIIMITIPTM